MDAQLHTDPDVRTTVKLRVIGRAQQLIRVDEDAWDWDRVADVVEKSSTRTFTWRSPDAAKSVVADRLTALEKVAAALPDDPQDEG